MFITCELALCLVVGKADPHPNILTSNFSMSHKCNKNMIVRIMSVW